MGRERVLGIPYHNVTTAEALQQIELFFKDGKTHIITFLSLPTIMLARKSKFLRVFLEEADLIVPCGKHVYWAARFLRRPLREIIDPSQLAKLIMRLAGRDVEIIHGAPRPGDVRHSLADISRAKTFGYNPEYSLEDGLSETIRWFNDKQG